MPTALYAGNASAGSVGRPQPQTTVAADSAGPFIRHARAASRPGYTTNPNFGGLVTLPLPAAPGYVRSFQLTFSLAPGTTTSAAFAADGPYNLSQFIQLKDPWATTIFSGPGYEMLYLVPKFSGQFWLFANADASALGSFSTVSASTGAFTFRSALSLEITKGYGCMSIGNASVLPTLTWQLSPAATVLSGTLTTLGALTMVVDEEYYDIDPANVVEPPGLGTTVQWAVVQANQPLPSNAILRMQFPRTGGYLTTIIVEARDSTGARVDTPWTGAGRIRCYIDGVPWKDETVLEAFDRMQGQFGYAASGRPAGTFAYTFKDSVSQVVLGLWDTLETVMLTNPGTQIEIEAAPWGTFANAPGALFVLFGQLVPTGPLAQGAPEL